MSRHTHYWIHCEKHNIDYPSGAECPKCETEEWKPDKPQILTIDESIAKKKISNRMDQFRIKQRETPKGEIECPIGRTVNPNNLCPKCAYATGCSSYEDYLNDEDSHKPDKDSEALLIEPLQIRLRLREIYWNLRAKLSEFKDWIRYIWYFSIKKGD